MREILFRGKRADNGEWVEGNYILQNDDNPERENYMKPYIKLRNYVNKYEVIPETVGQYTGLTDKNGKKIFEGDIIHCITFGFDREEFITEIKFGPMFGVQGFYLGNRRNLFYFGQSDPTIFDDGAVIGNIHDNPELLKGGADNG